MAMAATNCPLKTPTPLILKPSSRSFAPRPSSLLLRNPNPNPSSSPSLCRSFPSSSPFCPGAVASTRGGRPRCGALGGGGVVAQGGVDYKHERVVHPRPAEIPWRKDLANAVHLIGVVGAPVQIKHLSSGKVLAWTRLGVRRSPTDATWINLTLWDDLAHVAFQHVEKGQQIYVSGRLVSDSVEGDGDKRQVYYKVVVQQLNFIEKSFPPVPLYEPDNTSSATKGWKEENDAGNKGSSPEELWQAFFANPVDWWDNRKNKKNPKYPDFKHKYTGEALWIEGRYNPSWVRSQLAILDSRMSSLQANNVNPLTSFICGDELTKF